MVKICNLYIYLKILNGYLFGISSENVSFSLVVGWIKLILLANSAIFILLEFFPLPPLAEQHRIVEKLDKIFEKIESMKK